MFLQDKFGALPKIPCLGLSVFPLTEGERDREKLTASQESANQTQARRSKGRAEEGRCRRRVRQGWNDGTREKIPSFKGGKHWRGTVGKG